MLGQRHARTVGAHASAPEGATKRHQVVGQFAAAGVTQVNTIAAITNILIQRPRSEYDASHRIRKLYGAPISPDVYRAYREQFGVLVLIVWSERRGPGIPIRDGGSSFITINCCPWCGSKISEDANAKDD